MDVAHVTTRRMPAVKPVGKPDAGNPHVRFDERGGETGRASDTAPLLDSTGSACFSVLKDLLACLWDQHPGSVIDVSRLAPQ